MIWYLNTNLPTVLVKQIYLLKLYLFIQQITTNLKFCNFQISWNDITRTNRLFRSCFIYKFWEIVLSEWEMGASWINWSAYIGARDVWIAFFACDYPIELFFHDTSQFLPFHFHTYSSKQSKQTRAPLCRQPFLEFLILSIWWMNQ